MSSLQIFKDRTDAGQQLATLLGEYKGTDAIILAIPRGGVIVAKEIAKILNLPIDIIVTRKIGAPENDECAIGAIDISGNGLFNEDEKTRVDKKWLANKIRAEKKEAERRWSTYRKCKIALNLRNKIAIIVDDGIATGLTMEVAIEYAKREGAQKVVVAVPIAPADTVYALKKKADVRVLEIPSVFSAVGEWYGDFPQVSDKEVIATLSVFS